MKHLSKCTCITIGIAFFVSHWTNFGQMLYEYNAVFNNDSNSQPHSGNVIICETIPTLRDFSYSLGNGLVYLFLWLRQKVFYIHPSLKILNGRWVKIFSNGIMVIWSLFCFSLIFVYFTRVKHHFNEYVGCLISEESFDAFLILILSFLIVASFMQVVLLGLFVYPILKQSSWRNRQNNVSNSCLMRRVKKAVILASICLATDFLSLVLVLSFYEKNVNVETFGFSVNVVVNHVITVACFDNWKQIIWPWNLDVVNVQNQCDGIREVVPSSTVI